jgi:hypothetical protein
MYVDLDLPNTNPPTTAKIIFPAMRREAVLMRCNAV